MLKQPQEGTFSQLDLPTRLSILAETVDFASANDKDILNILAQLEPLGEEKQALSERERILDMQIAFLQAEAASPSENPGAAYAARFAALMNELVENHLLYLEPKVAKEQLPSAAAIRQKLTQRFSAEATLSVVSIEELTAQYETIEAAAKTINQQAEPLTNRYYELTAQWQQRADEQRKQVEANYAAQQHPLAEACHKDDVSFLRKALKPLRFWQEPRLINTPDAKGHYPLLIACQGGRVAVVQELVKRGADLTVVDRHGKGVLHMVAECRKTAKVAPLLDFFFRKQCPLDRATPVEARTPLHRAAYFGNLAMVRWLITHHVSLDAAESDTVDACTALHWAVAKGHVEVVAALLVAGARTDMVTVAGETALVSACIEYAAKATPVHATQQQQPYAEILREFLNKGQWLTLAERAKLIEFEQARGTDILGLATKFAQLHWQTMGREKPQESNTINFSLSPFSAGRQLSQSSSFLSLMRSDRATNTTTLQSQPLVMEKIVAEDILQLLQMQHRFVTSYVNRGTDDVDWQSNYQEQFNATIDEMVAAHKAYCEQRQLPVPSVLQLKQQYSAFATSPIQTTTNIVELLKKLEQDVTKLQQVKWDSDSALEEASVRYSDRHDELREEGKASVSTAVAMYHQQQHELAQYCRSGDLNGLIQALKNDSEKSIQKRINTPNQQHDYLLLIAIRQGHVAIVQHLLTLKARVGVVDKHGRGVFHVLAECRNPEAVTQLLSILEHAGADYQLATPIEQRTPLHRAAHLGNLTMVRWLLDKHVVLDQPESVQTQSYTALHWAARAGHAQIVRLLLAAGANVDALSAYGESPLLLACLRYADMAGKAEQPSACLDTLCTFLSWGRWLDANEWGYLHAFPSSHQGQLPQQMAALTATKGALEASLQQTDSELQAVPMSHRAHFSRS